MTLLFCSNWPLSKATLCNWPVVFQFTEKRTSVLFTPGVITNIMFCYMKYRALNNYSAVMIFVTEGKHETQQKQTKLKSVMKASCLASFLALRDSSRAVLASFLALRNSSRAVLASFLALRDSSRAVLASFLALRDSWRFRVWSKLDKPSGLLVVIPGVAKTARIR